MKTYKISFKLLFHSLIILLLYLQSCKKEEYSEINQLLRLSQKAERTISLEDIEHLPSSLQSYLINSKLIGTPNQYNAWFYYSGNFKLTDNVKWSPIEAATYVTGNPISRNYLIELASPMGEMSGFDNYYAGEGHMSIRYFSGISFMEADGPKLDTSELVTLLADFPVCPAFFLIDGIEYEVLTANSIKITIADAGMSCSGTFYFNEQGLISKFTSNDRYKNESDMATTQWVAKYYDYKEINGILVPNYMEGGWETNSGLALYAKVTLSDVEYNINGYR